MKAAMTGYDRVSRVNHWVLAALMIGMLIMGFYVFKVLPDGPDKGALVGVHKSLGVLVLMLGSWRVAWRLRQGFLPDGQVGWQARLAHWAHRLLLAGIVVMPVSGLGLSFFGGRETGVFGVVTIPAGPKIELVAGLASAVHGAFALVLVLTLALHVLGAMKHALYDRDGTMARMAPKL